MKLLYNKIFLEHNTGTHPENKKRLLSLGKLQETEIENGEQYLKLIYTKNYISHIKEICSQGGGALDNDTIVSRTTNQRLVACLKHSLPTSGGS